MVKELTKEEFESTISSNMRLLDENDDSCASIPLVEYVEQCIGQLQLNGDIDDMEIHYAYMNDTDGFCHVGFNFGDENTYLVVVVNMNKQEIWGHCVLDISLASV